MVTEWQPAPRQRARRAHQPQMQMTMLQKREQQRELWISHNTERRASSTSELHKRARRNAYR